MGFTCLQIPRPARTRLGPSERNDSVASYPITWIVSKREAKLANTIGGFTRCHRAIEASQNQWSPEYEAAGLAHISLPDAAQYVKGSQVQ